MAAGVQENAPQFLDINERKQHDNYKQRYIYIAQKQLGYDDE